MSDNPEEFLTGSLDDYLLAVADSIHQAQLKLSRMRIPAQPGQPSITYQLPRLDFELKMSFEVAQKSSKEGGTGGLVLNARPVSAQQASARSSTAEAASIIKGSFIAVPLDGGKPPSVIRTSLYRNSSRSLEITVTVQSATGENLSGVEVQFNIDLDRSYALNQLEGITETPAEGAAPQPYHLKSGTFLAAGKVTTIEGRAVNTLTVDSAEVRGAYIVIIIDVSGETQTIVFKVEM